MSAPADTAIRTHELRKTYGKLTALNGLNLEVPTGSIVGVIGPNGAGKSTTMKTLVDLVRPTSGSVEVLGHNPRTAGPALRRRIGYLPGEFMLDGRVTGAQVLKHYCALTRPQAAARINPLGERLGVDLSRPIRTLSKGNKQKIGLIQAFIHEPELLILDEPTSGIDPLVQREFMAMLQEATANGATVFLSSHVLAEIEHIADAAAVLRRGKIVADATIAQLRARAGHVLHARLVTTDEAAVRQALGNFLPTATCHLSPAGDGTLRIEAAITGTHSGADVLGLLNTFTIADFTYEPQDFEVSVLDMYAEEPADDDS